MSVEDRSVWPVRVLPDPQVPLQLRDLVEVALPPLIVALPKIASLPVDPERHPGPLHEITHEAGEEQYPDDRQRNQPERVIHATSLPFDYTILS